MANTTIQIKKEIREILKKKKKYGRESYNEVIKRLIKKDRRKLG